MSKWIRGRLHTSLGFIKVDLDPKVEVDNRIFSPTIGLSEEKETKAEDIIIITIGTIIGPTIEIDPQTITDVTTEEIATSLIKDENNHRQDNRRRDSYRQDNRNRQNYRGNDSRQRYRDRMKSRDRSRTYSNDSARGKDRSRVETEMDRCNLDQALCQMTEKGQSPDLTQE